MNSKQHTTLHTQENDPSTSETCFAGSMMCCGCIGVLGLFAGAIAYIVFGIMYLVQDYDVAHDCKDSSLWAYVLVAIILSLGRTNSKKAFDDESELGVKICTLGCVGLIELGLGIWGGIELFSKSCSDLQDSNLWKFGLATFIIQMFCVGMIFVVIPIIMVILACLDKPSEPTTNNLEYSPTTKTDIEAQNEDPNSLSLNGVAPVLTN